LKLMMRTVPLLALLLFGGVQLASAQGVSAYFGLGSATASANKGINDFANGFNDVGPSMGGVFGKFGADFFIKPHLGIGGEYTFRFAQMTYFSQEGLNARPTFYDFNAIWHPSTNSRIVPEIQGGLGGADIKFYVTGQSCVTNNSCKTQSQFLQSSNHFQLHFGVGVRLYVRGNLYVRPQFDIHWVHNLTDEFGRNWVPEYGAAVGYTFGAR
jgi:Outer membrane protein beta-barrel domain